MEIEDIRKELNHLLGSVVDHSTKYSGERPIPSLEISFVLSKINKMQENLSVLRHMLEEKEKTYKEARKTERQASVIENKQEEIASTKEVPETLEDQTENVSTGQSENLDQSISKLTDALTLNDRYLFANELFNKDMNAFNELVKSIDNCVSISDAKALFLSSWDEENEHVQSFTILIERRFS